MNISNFVNGIGSAVVPFEFYKSVEVKTGGYPAEFGRGTGAMINAVTKSGSNDFTFALHGNYEPDKWREQMPNTTIARNSLAHRTDKSFTIEAGGPIIRDRLFFYGLASYQNLKVQNATNNTSPTAVRSSVTKDRTADPFYAFKLDGYITDRQHLEITYFDTSRKRKRDSYQYTLIDNQINANTGTIRAQLAIRQVLACNEAYVMPKPELYVMNAPQRFDADGILTDEAVRQSVRDIVAALVVWTRRLRSE